MDIFSIGNFIIQITYIVIVWFLLGIVFVSIKKYTSDLFKNIPKSRIWILTGVATLFIYIATFHSPYYSGFSSSNSNSKNGTVEYIFMKSDIDNLEPGVYLWKDDKTIFIRKLTDKEKESKSINEKLTKEILEPK